MPAWVLAVNVGAVAVPVASVATIAVREPLNDPLAPLEGAVNVTFTPTTGLPPLSLTRVEKAAEKADVTWVL